ncbi:hypothetical protein L6R50_14745 [Myxococcota bacterium]|nr:hypothetical protein [Myxococcota bacterium]
MSVSALRWLAGRAATAALVVVGASVLFGAVLWISPGSPRGEDGGPGSLVGWIAGFWSGVLRGDLGASHRGLPVVTLVVNGAARTLPVVGAALGLSIATALALGWAFLAVPWPRARAAVRVLVQAASLLPVFLLAYAASAWGADFELRPGATYGAAVLVLGLGNGTLAELMLHLEGEAAALSDRDWMHAVRSRGASAALHAAPAIALPALGLAVGRASGWGYYGYAAARNEDLPLLVAIAVAATAAVAGLQLAADALRLAIDPRLRGMAMSPAGGEG